MRRHSRNLGSRAATAGWLILAGNLALAAGASADVYRWVDREGIVHYSDIPTDESNVERVAVQTHRPEPAVTEQPPPPQELEQARQLREQQQAQDAASEADRRAEVQRQREQNCRIARQRVESYTTAHRLYRPLPNGERDYLTDEELDAARAEAMRAVEEWCGPS